MCIVHVSPTAFGVEGLYGGGERYPLELARALSRHADCRFVTFGDSPRTFRRDGVTVQVLKTALRLRNHPAHPLGRGLADALRPADIVHTHHTRSTPSRLAAAIARARRTPCVTTDHGLGGGGWLGLLPRMFDLHLPVSEHAADVLAVPARRTRIIYGGTDPQRFFPGDEVRRGVLFVGRITPHKGLDVLVHALPPGAHLLVAGSVGHDRRLPERDYPQLVRRMARGRPVRFVVAPSDAELPGLYRAAEVFVLPSVATTCYGKRVRIVELLGLSVIEAMASGTPVVCSRIGALPEVVVDGETGFLVEPGNAEELGDRMAAILGDPARARRMGQAARARVLDSFTWEDCAHRCLAAYEEVLAER